MNLDIKPLKLNSKFILLLAMAYVTVSISADVVAFKFVNFLGLLESGATIIFPLTYIIGDVTCEVYGWSISMRIVWIGLLCETLFALLITFIIHLPVYNIGHYQNEFSNVLGNVWLFVFAGIVSNAMAGLFNIFLISKSKIMSKGRVFWLRSLLSTLISELILVFITGIIAFMPFLNVKNTFHILLDAYLLEIIYALIFVFPAQLLVNSLRKEEGIDAYDYGISYNPFRFV